MTAITVYGEPSIRTRRPTICGSTVGIGSAQPASQALLIDRARGAQRGLALSTYFMGFDVGIGLGAIVLGVISQTFGWQAMWTVSAIAIALGLVGVWYSRRPSPWVPASD